MAEDSHIALQDTQNSFLFMERSKGGKTCTRQLRKEEKDTSVIMCHCDDILCEVLEDSNKMKTGRSGSKLLRNNLLHKLL